MPDDNKVALITGSGHGIGKAAALRLAGRGWTVAINDLKPEFVDEAVAEVASRREAPSRGARIASASAMRPKMHESVGRGATFDASTRIVSPPTRSEYAGVAVAAGVGASSKKTRSSGRDTWPKSESDTWTDAGFFGTCV